MGITAELVDAIGGDGFGRSESVIIFVAGWMLSCLMFLNPATFLQLDLSPPLDGRVNEISHFR